MKHFLAVTGGGLLLAGAAVCAGLTGGHSAGAIRAAISQAAPIEKVSNLSIRAAATFSGILATNPDRKASQEYLLYDTANNTNYFLDVHGVTLQDRGVISLHLADRVQIQGTLDAAGDASGETIHVDSITPIT